LTSDRKEAGVLKLRGRTRISLISKRDGQRVVVVVVVVVDDDDDDDPIPVTVLCKA
jgi:hypothetical protein